MHWNTQNAQLIWFTVTWKEGKKKWSKTSTQRRHRLHLFTLFFMMCFFYEIISFFCFFLSFQSTIRRKSLVKPFFLKENKIKSFSLKSFMSRLCCDTIETRLFCYEIYVLSHFIRFVCPFVRSVIRQLIT